MVCRVFSQHCAVLFLTVDEVKVTKLPPLSQICWNVLLSKFLGRYYHIPLTILNMAVFDSARLIFLIDSKY